MMFPSLIAAATPAPAPAPGTGVNIQTECDLDHAVMPLLTKAAGEVKGLAIPLATVCVILLFVALIAVGHTKHRSILFSWLAWIFVGLAGLGIIVSVIGIFFGNSSC
jgi:protein-S-isoprenylcysteine O-methyltransferase Ste14